MTYIELEELSVPSEGYAWRYMPFKHFSSLILNQQLHFSRVDQFDDPYEGSIPRTIAKKRSKERPPELAEADKILNEKLRRFSFANCWHQDIGESGARWERYGYDDIVAVRSSISGLKSAVERWENPVCLGRIKYIDFSEHEQTNLSNELPRKTNTAEWVMTKRMSFQYENEIRLLTQPIPAINEDKYEELEYNIVFDGEQKKIPLRVNNSENETGMIDLRDNPERMSFKVDVNVGDLVESVHINPKAESDFVEMVQKLVSCSPIQCPVRQSELDSQIIY